MSSPREGNVPVAAFEGVTVRYGRTLVVALGGQESFTAWREDTSFLVDLVGGTVTPLGRGYQPVAVFWWLGPGVAPKPGSAASRIFVTPDGTFSVLDPSGKGYRTLRPARWYGE